MIWTKERRCKHPLCHSIARGSARLLGLLIGFRLPLPLLRVRLGLAVTMLRLGLKLAHGSEIFLQTLGFKLGCLQLALQSLLSSGFRLFGVALLGHRCHDIWQLRLFLPKWLYKNGFDTSLRVFKL